MKHTLYLLLFTLFMRCDTDKISYTHAVNGIEPLGPYSQATAHGEIIFTSGQLGLNPENNELEADIERQTIRALNNLKSVLEQSGSDVDHVLKTTVYLTDMVHFPTVNKIYGRFFIGAKPARTTLQVAALPNNALIEIECIATKK